MPLAIHATQSTVGANTNAAEIVVLGSLLQNNTANLPATLTDPFVAIVNTTANPTSPNQRQQFRDVTLNLTGSPYELNFYPLILQTVC